MLVAGWECSPRCLPVSTREVTVAVHPHPRGDRVSDRGNSRDVLTVAVRSGAADGELAVTIRGEVDLETAPLLQQRLTDAIDGDARDLVLDVTGVSFCDVTGLQVILRVRSQLSSRGCRLSLVGPCRSLQIMIWALALEDELPIITRTSATDPASAKLADEGEHAS